VQISDQEARENQLLAEQALRGEKQEHEDSQPDPLDLALRWCDIEGRRYPILTPLELHILSRLGLEDYQLDEEGRAIAGAYVVWLAQRRLPGHLARLGRLLREPIPAKLTRIFLPGKVRWWHRVWGWVIGRRPYDWLDFGNLPRLIAGHMEYLRKKAQGAGGILLV
jgi:hypothetical protein